MRQKGKGRMIRLIGTALLAALILWLAAVTARCVTAHSAIGAVTRQGDLALSLLKSQLIHAPRENALPASLALVVGQSPLLQAGRQQVLQLQRSQETEQTQSPPERTPAPEQTAPIQEEAASPDTPLVLADNGVPARTLIPASPEGYVVTGKVYIANSSDNTFDAGLFDGSFAAALAEEGPQVLILHTHGSEAYTMPAGQEYEPSGDWRTTDCHYNVVRVGEELAATLEAAGLTVLHDTTLHDYPEYSGAYNRSLSTAEEYLEKYPTISLVLDLHRDAVSDTDGSPYKVVSTVAGLSAAQMSFVIGTDGGGLEHPGWRENLKLAAAVQQKLLEDYPTLMRPITVRNSRYNQHTTAGSLLIEMGAAGNSLDEALLSARLLGQTIVQVMAEKTQ